MRHKWMLTMAMAFAATLAAFAQKKDSAEVMLGAGLHQEEVEGNCSEAIKTFQKLLQDKNTSRHVAARAQLHIGTCREKLGQRDARAAYEAVINRYADQPDVAGDARGRLAVLGVKPSSTLTARFFRSEDPTVIGNSISADGRFYGVTERVGDTGDVVVHDLATGESKTLYHGTCTALTRGRCKGSTVNTLLSPDGRQVTYALLADEAFELRLIPNETGAKSRLLISRPGVNIRPVDWTRNGQEILVLTQETRGGSEEQQLGFVSVQDGTLKVVKSFKQVLPLPYARVSPDGKYIAYHVRKTAEGGDLQIHIVAADGSAETQLTTANDNRSPVWSPDGGHILFISNRSGTFGLWAAGVKDGRPQGIPFSLKRDTGRILPIGIARSGSYYYVQAPSLSREDGVNVFEAELDPVTGKQKSPAKYLSQSFVGTNNGPSWSPDGKYVAFKRLSPQNNNIRNLVVRSMESGEERTYFAPDWTNVQYGFGPGIPLWFHDGSGIFVGSEPIPGQTRWLGRMTLDGQFTKLVQIPPQLGWVGALSPDDKTAYVFSGRTSPTSGYNSLVAVDLTTGEQKRVFDATDYRVIFGLDPFIGGTIMSAAVDGAGRRIAFLSFSQGSSSAQGNARQAALATIQVDGSGYRELYVTSKRMEGRPDQVQWTSDGQNVFFIEDGRVMRISAEGGTPEFIGIGGGTGSDRPVFISLRPDGASIAFSGGEPFSGGFELWALDNLASLLKSAK